MFNLRDYQDSGIAQIRASLASGKRAPIYVLPTGGGKTVVFCYIAYNALQKGKRVFILVHRDNLLEQASKKLTEFGIPHGRIGGSRSRTRDLVQVASVQSLVKRLDTVQEPDLIIVDEGHHLTKDTMWAKVVEKFKKARLIGVTATPIRLDGKGLGTNAGGYYDDMILGLSISDLISQGYLSQPVTYAPPSNIDLEGIGFVAGDFNKKQLIDRKNKSSIVGDSITHYKKLANGLPTVVFEISIEESEKTAKKFCDAGYNFVAIDGKKDRKFIRQAIDDLSNGVIQGLVSCDLISEGTDIPVVSCGILLRPTASTSLYMQQVGRVLRPYPGKRNAIILDHAGNCLRHGLVEQPRNWTLDGRPPKKRGEIDNELSIKITVCQSCFGTYEATREACPFCQTEKPFSIGRQIEILDGELELATSLIHEADDKTQRSKEIGAARTLEEFKAIAEKRGYAHGWAKHMYQWKMSKMGVAR